MVLLPVILLSGIVLRAQVRISSESEQQLLRDTPLETVFLHSNGTLFLPGEYLYFSLYCINTSTYRLSELSRVAYVQLIGENDRVAFTQKILLDGGRGQGDYFFPTELPSGNYKLVAYTHWMKNAGPEQFFMSDLTFVNPYRSDQNTFLSAQAPDAGCPGAGEADGDSSGDPASGQVLRLDLGQDRYRPGEEVKLGVQNMRGPRGYGSYSLSVRKADDLPAAPLVTSTGNALRYPDMLREIPQTVNDLVAIPEQRGELISGQVTDAVGGQPLLGRPLAISLPGEDFQIKQVLTDEEGKFYTYISRPFLGESGFVELLPPGETPVRFSWTEPYQWEPDISCFHPFRLDSAMAGPLLQRSVHNQIENSYFEVKPDTLQPVEAPDPFQGDVPMVFELDEYTRFPTLRETFVEVVNFVMVRKDAAGEDSFRVLPTVEQTGSLGDLDPPLVVMDGILVPNPGDLLEYDARLISTVKVLRGQYQIGGESYQGMVAMETIDAVYASGWESEFGERFSYLPPSSVKRYFRQAEPAAQVPDFRYQLLWEPDISIEGAGQAFTFLTSQVPGRYEVRLEGFTSYGKPISLLATLWVESE